MPKTRTLTAWTQVSGYSVYPGIFRIEEGDDQVIVSVRSREVRSDGKVACGESVAVAIPRDEFAELWKNLPPLGPPHHVVELQMQLQVATREVHIGAIVLWFDSDDAENDGGAGRAAVVTRVRHKNLVDLFVIDGSNLPFHRHYVRHEHDDPRTHVRVDAAGRRQYWIWPPQDWRFEPAGDAGEG